MSGLRRVGGDQPVQLSVRAGGRAEQRGAGDRQHGGVQARDRHSWTGRLAECIRDAGIPDGVFNFVTGGGGTVGQALIDDPRVAGITFTGSTWA